MLRVYNTLSRKKEALKPKKGKNLNIFVCGPTVYDFSHIGHARTYVVFDMAVKYLRRAGYRAFYLQNITDVDDKIIQRAAEQGQSPRVLARRFEKEYLKDMKSLGVDSVTEYARATDHIKEIISQVERMFKKGFAYEIEGDGVYFDISKFKEYGKLSRRTAAQAQDAVSRIDESKNKRNKGDFALWKLSKPGEPKWKSPWGMGRPGWHIEDTAITEKFFGPQYDIHGGAQDLIFPHHEAEITQMESISGKKPLVNYWMHTGFLSVKGEKMAKSLGNFITIRDFLEKHPARLLRFFALKTHYRSPIDYSAELLEQAQSELERIDEFIDRLRDKSQTLNLNDQSNPKFKNLKTAFEQAMEDDVNTPAAIAVIFGLVHKGNALLDKEGISKNDAKEILDFLKEIDAFFGFIFRGRVKARVPEEIQKLAQERERYRKERDWAKADEAREDLQSRGWAVEDIPSGPKLKKLK